MDSLIRVRRATARRSAVEARRVEAEAEWREAISEAIRKGESLRAIGKAAGVTHVRVLQIGREQ